MLRVPKTSPRPVRPTGLSIQSSSQLRFNTERKIKSKFSKGQRSKGQSPEETKSILPRVLSPRNHVGCTQFLLWQYTWSVVHNGSSIANLPPVFAGGSSWYSLPGMHPNPKIQTPRSKASGQHKLEYFYKHSLEQWATHQLGNGGTFRKSKFLDVSQQPTS